MNQKVKWLLSSFLVVIATVATSKITWFGMYEPEVPKKLKSKK
ncbi:cyclic lactone autoinducer peptide [Thomasclavelia cocleata]|jgi:cyclic lactone autoinducer peptide|nr:cyclic lactone autoinducer peptide [Thomasclavelia cocleata]MCI9630421.1 cyclic lactone autoinducer peptide [Thomasclavelia cocleata]